MVKATLAVIAGFALWSILWLAACAAVAAAAPEVADPNAVITSPGILLALLGISVVCSLAAGAVAMAVVGRRSLAPAAVLGTILLIVGIAVQAAAWDRMPAWYHLPFLVLLLPATLAGAADLRRSATSSVPT